MSEETGKPIKVKVAKTPATPGEIKPEEGKVPTADTFRYMLADGKIIEVGRPQGVLKLKLRNILSIEELQDTELVQIATAMLSIRKYDGSSLVLNNRLVFDAFLDKFGQDKYLDDFMNNYQKFIDPRLAEVIQESVEKALKAGTSPTELPAVVAQDVIAYQRRQIEDVKN